MRFLTMYPLKFIGLFCLLVLPCVLIAASPIITNTSLEIKCKNHLLILEDKQLQYDPIKLLSNNYPFQPLATFTLDDPLGTYWLKMSVNNSSNSNAVVLGFTNLTYVEVFLYKSDTIISHKYAGAFLPDSMLAPLDTRFSTLLSMDPGVNYTVLLKVNHTKHYHPVFDFTLDRFESFANARIQKERINFWLQGAVFLLFIYTFISWRFTRFRPYIWLLVFVGGIASYSISLSGYIVEWFFPVHPEIGWRFTIYFLHLGLLGFYLLIIDFWQLKKNAPILYKVGLGLILQLFVVSLISLGITLYSGNYSLINKINTYSFIFPISFIFYSMFRTWRLLTRAQRFLAYGIGLYAFSGTFITLGWIFFQEKMIYISPYVTLTSIIGVVLIFLTGLKEELKQMEADKNNMLRHLNLLQQNQNAMLEKKVQERTNELASSYEELHIKKNLLSVRNARIETLNNEINHRVKNNLQLLYSYINLQLPSVNDEAARAILKEHISRITAMMLVNQRLNASEENDEINVSDFLTELTINIHNTYDPDKTVILNITPANNIYLSGKKALSLGLIVSELLTNSFKHAFSLQQHPEISIDLIGSNNFSICLHYADNGTGMPANTKGNKKSSLGQLLIKDLIRQMNAQLTMENKNGLHYSIIITTHDDESIDY